MPKEEHWRFWSISTDSLFLSISTARPRHPLRLRTKKAHNSLHPTRLEKLAQLCSAVSNPVLDSCPWEERLFGGRHKCLTATGGTEDKKKAAANFNGKILGSGSAWILRWKERWLDVNGFSLGSKAEVYDAEVWGLCGGVEAGLTSPMVGLIFGIHICLI